MYDQTTTLHTIDVHTFEFILSLFSQFIQVFEIEIFLSSYGSLFFSLRNPHTHIYRNTSARKNAKVNHPVVTFIFLFFSLNLFTSSSSFFYFQLKFSVLHFLFKSFFSSLHYTRILQCELKFWIVVVLKLLREFVMCVYRCMCAYACIATLHNPMMKNSLQNDFLILSFFSARRWFPNLQI